MHRTLLWFISALTITAAFAPAALALMPAGSQRTCDQVGDELREAGLTHDNNTTKSSWMEWDNLKNDDCGELRDDLQRAVYDQTGIPTTYGCSSYMTPWTTCVGLNLEGCDLWVSWLTWQCVGGIFPDNTPK